MATQDVNSFKFWANKIIPLVYDDSLSYYEFLCKVLQKLNEVIGSVNAQNTTIRDMQDQIDAFIAAEQQAREDWELTETANRAAWELQQAQKMAAFELLFASDYDDTKSYSSGNVCRHENILYVANGSTTGDWNPAKWDQIVLADYLANYVQTAAADMQAQYDAFLENYQRDFGIVKTLGSSETDAVTQKGLTQAILNATTESLLDGKTMTGACRVSPSTGALITNQANYFSCDYIATTPGTILYFSAADNMAFYDANKDYISGTGQSASPVVNLNSTPQTAPESAAYFRCSFSQNYAGRALVTTRNYNAIGKLLKLYHAEMDMTKAVSIAAIGITNVLNVTTEGIYKFTAAQAANLTNIPSGTEGLAGAMIHFQSSSNAKVYIYITTAAADADNMIFIRSNFNNKWIKLWPIELPPVTNALLNMYYGKTINWIGDSIVYGTGDPQGDGFDGIVCETLGMSENDYGRNSATISYNDRGYRIISEWYVNMSDDADIIAVSAGTNDWYHADVPVGTINDATNMTFYGALNVLCEGLQNKYPGKVIFFTTPIKRAQSPYQALDAVNANGKTLKEYCDIIKEVCSKYSIPVLDMYSESGLVPQLTSQAGFFSSDKIHPNRYGAEIMARRVCGWLKQLM